MANVAFVFLLKYSERCYGILLGVIVDFLVTRSAEEHEVLSVMHIYGTRGVASSGTARLEGNDMRDLREVTLGEGHRVREEILVAAIKHAVPACRNEENEAGEGGHLAGRPHWRNYCRLDCGFRFLPMFVHGSGLCRHPLAVLQ